MRDKLKAPFEEKYIEWRVQQSGFSNDRPWAMVLAYVDARAVMNRLDDVLGIDKWYDEYEHKNNGVMCSLGCKIENTWIIKQDGSPETAVEAFKGGISKAFVRTAVKFGVGRYLYDLEANFADCSLEKKAGYRKGYDTKTKKSFYWKPPLLPSWALPDYPKDETKQKYCQLLKEQTGNNIHKDDIEEAKKMTDKEMQLCITELEVELRGKDE